MIIFALILSHETYEKSKNIINHIKNMRNLDVYKKRELKGFSLFSIIIFFMLLIPITVKAQDDIKTLDSLAETAIDNGNYARGYLLRTKQIDMLSKQVNKGDSNLILLIANRGMCMERLQKFDEALTEVKKAVELWSEFQDSTSFCYAGLLNYLSVCQMNANQMNAAIESSQKSISLLEKIPNKDMGQWTNLGTAHTNFAETLFKLKRFKEAIEEELKGLKIIEKYNGDDTTPYLNELESLHKYLKESGNEAAADKISMILEKGAADLRLPKVKEFASAEEASKYNTEALYCCKYYLDHPITAPKISEACLFFDNWNRLSKDVTVPYSDFENDICESTSGTLCFLAFEASIISNGLRYNTRFDKNIYLAAIIKMTKFYINNKEFIGIVPTLEPFAEAYSSDKLKIIKLAEAQYDALRKVMKGLPK